MARTRWQVRHSVSAQVRDLCTGTVSAIATQTLTVPELAHLSSKELNDSELFVYSGLGLGQSRRIKTHTQSDAGALLTPYQNWTTVPDTTSLVEISLHEFGWTVARKNDAIDQAYQAARDIFLEDVVDLSLSGQAGRRDYPLPTGLRYLSGVEVDHQDFAGPPGSVYDNGTLNWGTTYYDQDRGLASISAQTRLAQAFSVTAGGQPLGFWCGGVALYLRAVGTPVAGTLTTRLETTLAGLPTGTLLTAAATGTNAVSAVTGTYRLVRFAFGAPVFLPAGQALAVVLSTTAAVDAANYVAWGEDTGTVYPGGAAARYDGATWTAVSGSALVFTVQTSQLNERWVPLGRDDRLGPNWRVNPVGTTGELWLRDALEGRRLRLIGQGQATPPALDTDLVTLPEPYLVPKAAAILLASMGSGAQMDPDARDRWALFHSTRAENEIPRIRTPVRPNSEIVVAR